MKENTLIELKGLVITEDRDSAKNVLIRDHNKNARQVNTPIETALAEKMFKEDGFAAADKAYAATYLALRKHQVLNDTLDTKSSIAYNQQMGIRTAVTVKKQFGGLPAIAFDVVGSASIGRYFKPKLFKDFSETQLEIFANLYSGMLDARANSPDRPGGVGTECTNMNALNIIAENTVMMQACLAICRSNNLTIAKKNPHDLFIMGKNIASTYNLPLIVIDQHNGKPPIEMAVKQICVRALEYEISSTELAKFRFACRIQLKEFLDHSDPGYTLVKQNGVIPLDTAALAFNTRYEELVTQTSTLTSKFNELPEPSKIKYTKLYERITQIPSWQSSLEPLVAKALEIISIALETPDKTADLLKQVATNISFVESGIDKTEANLQAHIKQVTGSQPLNETMKVNNAKMQRYLATLSEKMTQAGNVSPDVASAITYLNGAIASQESALAHPSKQEAMLNNIRLKLQCAAAYIDATPDKSANLELVSIHLNEAQTLLNDKASKQIGANDVTTKAVKMLETAVSFMPENEKNKEWIEKIKTLKSIAERKNLDIQKSLPNEPPAPAPQRRWLIALLVNLFKLSPKLLKAEIKTATPPIIADNSQTKVNFNKTFNAVHAAITEEKTKLAPAVPSLAPDLAAQNVITPATPAPPPPVLQKSTSHAGDAAFAICRNSVVAVSSKQISSIVTPSVKSGSTNKERASS